MKYVRESLRKIFACRQKNVAVMAVVMRIFIIVLMDFVSRGEDASLRLTVKIMNSKKE